LGQLFSGCFTDNLNRYPDSFLTLHSRRREYWILH